MPEKIKVGIVGVSGYTGRELLRILKYHPNVQIFEVFGSQSRGVFLSNLHPMLNLKFDLEVKDFFSESHNADVYFVCVPHGKAQDVVSLLYREGKRVIDLSADYRLKEASVYENTYGVKHNHKDLLQVAVYGMPEIFKANIRNAAIVANPGCLARATLLSLYPLLDSGLIKNKDCVVVDAKTGVSGAGMSLRDDLHFPHMNENLKPYAPLHHRHVPEIIQEISNFAGFSINLMFVPHLVAIDRGILVSTYFTTSEEISNEKLFEIYSNFYSDSPFVKVIYRNLPEIKNVRATNYVQIGFETSNNSGVVFVALDNLTSGASANAVHNMNIMFDFKETSGLEEMSPLYP
ncbi:MAG: N-acetyl-gamma-glutamyl-phosphate reductase [Actinobacteria bacterium]|nr:N-acetyl-gamma-glutamyl-phosphate reductase [Actinomycetota bacterium]